MINSKRKCLNCGHEWECNPTDKCKLPSTNKNNTYGHCISLCISCYIKKRKIYPRNFDKLFNSYCYKKENKNYIIASLL